MRTKVAKLPFARCPSCGHNKWSAAKNNCGLCDECNGGPDRRRVRRPVRVPESVVAYMAGAER